MVMQVRRTLTVGATPTGLAEGQISVGMADQPPIAWVGVPASVNPAGVIPITGLVRTVAGAPQPAGALGQLWWDEDAAQLFVYTGAEWVVAVNWPGGSSVTFPASPAPNQVVTDLATNTAWRWDAPTTRWVATTAGAPFTTQAWVNQAIQDAFDAYQPPSDIKRQNRNRIINGGFQIDQWGAQAGLTPVDGQFVADRFRVQLSAPGRLNTSIGNWFSPNLVPGASRQLALVAVGNFAPDPVNDSFQLIQPVEFVNIADWRWGGPDATPVTLSFWVSGTPGTYGGALTNQNNTRCYPFTYTLTGAGFQYFAITIPGETSGTWYAGSPNLIGAFLRFDLGVGENSRGPTGAWSTVPALGASGTGRIVGVNGAALTLCNIQLEIGPEATPFDYKSLTVSQLECFRYRYVPGVMVPSNVWLNAGDSVYITWQTPVPMRDMPTISGSFAGSSNMTGVSIAMNAADLRTVIATGSASASGTVAARLNITSLTAEL